MKRLPFPWRELIGGLCLVATLLLSRYFPMGFAPAYEAHRTPERQQPAASSAIAAAAASPRAKGARLGEEPIDTSRRADRAGSN